MKILSFNNSISIPTVGYGTWRLPGDTAEDLTATAIKNGYRHIDCAMVYGNEKEVGKGISKAISDKVVKRDDLFITSKLWNTDHAAKDVAAACRKTLEDLGLEYLDLYLVHWNVGFEHGDDLEPLDENGLSKFSFVPLSETWKAMEKLVDEGLVKSIGVANFTAPMLIDLLSFAKVKPVMNQIELHPYNAQNDLIGFCHIQGVQVTAYSPLGSVNAPLLKDKSVVSIAESHQCSPAQVLLAWAVQRGTAVIPKSSTEARMKENLDSENLELTEEEMKTLNNLDQHKIFVNPIDWWGFPYFN